MRILQLPTELLQIILISAILERGIRRGLRLRVVCKRFAEEVIPALYHTRLLDAHCNAHGQPPARLRAHYLVHRILAEKRYLTSELRAIKRTANALMVENGISLSDDDTRGEYLLTLCTLATRAGTCVKRFFRRNTNYVHDEDEDGRNRDANVFVAAVYMGFMTIVQRKIGLFRLPLNMWTSFGSPIEVAAMGANDAILDLLMSKSTMLSSHRHTALVSASEAGQVSTVETILEDRWGRGQWSVGWDHRITRDTIATSLKTRSISIFENIMALKRERAPGKKALLSDGQLGDLLFNAARNGETDMACYLLDVYAAPADGWPHHDGPMSKRRPIIEACRHGDWIMVEKLLQYRADTTNAMSTAAGGGHLQIVRCLIEHGVSINGGSPPPIVRAVELEHTGMFRLLREHGARLNTPETGGEAVSRAKGQGLDSMLDLLEEEGLGIEYFFASRSKPKPDCYACRGVVVDEH